jgi:hypothetical protein
MSGSDPRVAYVRPYRSAGSAVPFSYSNATTAGDCIIQDGKNDSFDFVGTTYSTELWHEVRHSSSIFLRVASQNTAADRFEWTSR